ncbi:pentatricopeptide repeat-containing protein At3g22470, mitochondrial-like [Papaver somniferum]|uniref:pentatricopeptide repeat-containing protein At3g22470, mitochondrial-like n=1 Tax=Papaver somniferum TaxID=3469 RepID=UPI000E6FBD77|nr:pentatricopeptide repeat-containing protein At3g22470, mitochondrial-like [Papaver somniferum]
MVSRGISADVTTYNSMIHGHCLHGQQEEARRYFDEMMDHGISPDVVNFSILIDSPVWYCKNRKLGGAMQLFKKMKQNGLKPTTITYNMLLRALLQDGRVRAAKNLFNEMETSGLFLNIVTYGTMLDGYCKNGKMDEAIALFESMEDTGVSANEYIYSILIHGLFRTGSMSLEAEKLITEMEEKGCLPTGRAYDIIIRGFLMAKENYKALHFLRKMRVQEFVPSDSVIFFLVNTLSADELKDL